MSKALEAKVNELYEATKDLQSFEEMKPHCDRFNSWIALQEYSVKSLGTVLSRAGFYKKFKELDLEQGKNAVSVPQLDKNGNQVGTQLKHYVLTQCGLTDDEWLERNTTTRATKRLENSNEIDPEKYFRVVAELLESDEPHELAVGLICATGRRPHEILARAKFTAIESKDYHVMFSGQGKKRGEKPVFEIATLFPSGYIIQQYKKLQQHESIRTLLKEVKANFPRDISEQNRSIDSRRNGSLNRVVRAKFDNRDNDNPALALRHDEEQNNCKALRAAYANLATARDCSRSIGEQMLHAAKLLGHYTHEEPTDRDLQNLMTTLSYTDYYVEKPVPFPPMEKNIIFNEEPFYSSQVKNEAEKLSSKGFLIKNKKSPIPVKKKKESLGHIRVYSEDVRVLKELQKEWSLPNQKVTVKRLIEIAQNAKQLEAQLLGLNEKNKELKIQRFASEKKLEKADQSSEKLLELQREIEKLKAQRAEHEKQLEKAQDLSETLLESQREIEELKSQRASYDKELEKAKGLSEKLLESQAEIEELRSQRASYERQLEKAKQLEGELLESQTKIEELKAQRLEPEKQLEKAKQLESKVLELQTENEELKIQQASHEKELEMENLDARISRILDEKLSKLFPQPIAVETPTASEVVSTKKTFIPQPKEDDTDWEGMSSEELKQNRTSNAAEEKLRRSFLALTSHNDMKATSNDERWVINNQALRQLSGCNGMVVKDWMNRHRVAIDDHNGKYGLGLYHNKGRGDITEVIQW
ncbi:MAG: protelomerase family protein [Prochloraceae cyanobacterium]|nr:protelomerase family protein [Prochloraceae cyanobacterium]